jgi:hypothetical protein
MSFDNCSFGCGGMNRALSASAVNLDSKVTIVVIALPPSAQSFGFSATGTGLSAFSRVNDGVSINSITFNNLLAPATSANYSVGENLGSIGSYSLQNIGCSVTGTSTASPNIPLGLVNLTLNYGDSITCIFTNAIPTAAAVSAAGRVTDSSGNGISRASVTIQDSSNGQTRSVQTNSFGYYRFDNLPSGNLYVITVAHRRYSFEHPSQVFQLVDAVENIDFQASPD